MVRLGSTPRPSPPTIRFEKVPHENRANSRDTARTLTLLPLSSTHSFPHHPPTATIFASRAAHARVSLTSRRTAVRPCALHRKRASSIVRAESGRNGDAESKSSEPSTSSSSTEEALKKSGGLIDFDEVMASIDKVAARYDWLSASLGALAGTSYGVYRGQPVGQALGITICATVVALAVDEMINDHEKNKEDRQ